MIASAMSSRAGTSVSVRRLHRARVEGGDLVVVESVMMNACAV